MAEMQELKDIVADLMKVEASALDGGTVLAGLLASSMGRARLDAVLRKRMGIADPAVYTVKTFGELARLTGLEAGGSAAPAAAANPSLSTEATSGEIALGIDMQSLDAMPETADFWEEAFYQQHFTPQEVAYALLQANPRESLAAAWCAKEALRKADSRWIGVDWKLTEVTHDAQGRPSLKSGSNALPHAVSLSHTGGFALAVVALGPPAAPAPPVVTATAPPALHSAEATGGSSKLPLLLAVLALLISLASVAYMAWH
jgi:phosphopantetheine--protein transferase-like protein